MTKPRLGKVRALFYVFQLIKKETASILTQPLYLLYPFLIIFPIKIKELKFSANITYHIKPPKFREMEIFGSRQPISPLKIGGEVA